MSLIASPYGINVDSEFRKIVKDLQGDPPINIDRFCEFGDIQDNLIKIIQGINFKHSLIDATSNHLLLSTL